MCSESSTGPLETAVLEDCAVDVEASSATLMVKRL